MGRSRDISLRTQLGSEDGVGIVEVLVAAILLIVGALATMGLVDAAHRQNFRAEQSQVITNRLQAEMEAIKRLEYTKIALTATPAQVATPDNPSYRVGSLAGAPAYALNRNGTSLAPLVVNGSESVSGGVVDPGPTPFVAGDLGGGTEGDIRGDIYRYVTWIDDPDCGEACPGTTDLKRIIVAIKLDDTIASGDRAGYVELQSDVVDGSLAQQDGATPGPPAEAEAVPYSLSDTPCAESGSNPRAVPSSHDAHNTLGACSAGVQSGATPGAPDRLYHSLRSPVPGSQTDPYDFSLDVATQQPTDEGLQMPVQPKVCDYAPSRAEAGVQVHRWVTAPVTDSDFVLDGTASLTLYSKTINSAVHSAKLCIWVFVREPTATGGEADSMVTDATTGSNYFTYSTGATNWNAGPSWGPAYNIPLIFQELRLQPGDRLGLALAVDAAGTPGEALQFRYDHPDHDSIFTVYSTTKNTAPN
jgi:hypothetical protein